MNEDEDEKLKKENIELKKENLNLKLEIKKLKRDIRQYKNSYRYRNQLLTDTLKYCAYLKFLI